ncbi:MAG: restriction endonuclease subunit S, partial [Paramuribaculum sp.]|nr:restriction endonuclease subunit S [Paramuribaculum sp.]
IDLLCPNGVELKPLGELVEILDSLRKPVAKGKRSKGEFPYYGANGIQDYVDEYIFDGKFLLVGEDGSVINPDKSPVLNWVEGKIWVNNHAHILREVGDNSLRYVYYALQICNVSEIVRGTPPKLNQANLRNILIPVPPIEVQEEIVRILDTFSAHAAELQAELQARKEQYEYYRNLLLTFNSSACGYGTDGEQEIKVTTWGGHSYEISWKTMEEVFEMRNGYTPSKNKPVFWDGGTIPWFRMEDIRDFGRILSDSYQHITPAAIKGKGLFEKNSFILATTATIGEHAMLIADSLANQQFTNLKIRKSLEDKLVTKFIYYYMFIVDEFCKNNTNVSGFASVDMGKLKKMRFPIPPLELQEKIVSILDRFETLVNDLTQGLPAEIAAVKEQYEYYRNKLLTFTPLSA